jgi:hypothetical protein
MGLHCELRPPLSFCKAQSLTSYYYCMCVDNLQAIYNGASPRRTPTDDVERRRDSTGRDVGNSYAFSFDLLGCLLDTFAEFPLLERYGSNLERSLQWAEDNILLQYYDEACDVEAMTVVGKPLRGWRSSHLQQEVRKRFDTQLRV